MILFGFISTLTVYLVKNIFTTKIQTFPRSTQAEGHRITRIKDDIKPTGFRWKATKTDAKMHSLGMAYRSVNQSMPLAFALRNAETHSFGVETKWFSSHRGLPGAKLAVNRASVVSKSAICIIHCIILLYTTPLHQPYSESKKNSSFRPNGASCTWSR